MIAPGMPSSLSASEDYARLRLRGVRSFGARLGRRRVGGGRAEPLADVLAASMPPIRP